MKNRINRTIYRPKYGWIRKNDPINKILNYILITSIFCSMSVYIGSYIGTYYNKPLLCPIENCSIVSPVQATSPHLPASPSPVVNAGRETRGTTGKSWTGKASWYSRSGCIGCSATLHMANGQPLDDNKKTIAFNWFPLNTKVRITNTRTNMVTYATVTDRHGAYKAKYGYRIADVTPAVRDALNMKTDDVVIVEEIK